MRIIYLFILFTFISKVGICQPSNAPTKEDAVAFINKLIKDYPRYDDINMNLDGCTLIITNVKTSWGSGNKPETYKEKDVFSIDLSSVYFYDGGPNNFQLKPSFSTSIIENVHRETLSYENSRVKLSSDDLPEKLSFMNIFDWLKNMNDMPGDFHDKNYAERYLKAFTFLVTACGGGTIKADPNDKF